VNPNYRELSNRLTKAIATLPENSADFVTTETKIAQITIIKNQLEAVEKDCKKK
jgi:hypothetical protein